MFAGFRKARRCIRELSMSRKTVATHASRKRKNLRVVKALAAWWRSNGSDRYDEHHGQWIHSPLPPTPEKTTASMWADVNSLRKEISISEKVRSKQRVKSFLNDLEQGTASVTDKEIARLKRMIMERGGHAAAHVVVSPISTAQLCNSRSRC